MEVLEEVKKQACSAKVDKDKEEGNSTKFEIIFQGFETKETEQNSKTDIGKESLMSNKISSGSSLCPKQTIKKLSSTRGRVRPLTIGVLIFK